jgi:hypothetical protein
MSERKAGSGKVKLQWWQTANGDLEDDEIIPPMGAMSVFTQSIRGRTRTIVSANDGGFDIDFRISPGEAFRIARQLVVSAIKAKTSNRGM